MQTHPNVQRLTFKSYITEVLVMFLSDAVHWFDSTM